MYIYQYKMVVMFVCGDYGGVLTVYVCIQYSIYVCVVIWWWWCVCVCVMILVMMMVVVVCVYSNMVGMTV